MIACAKLQQGSVSPSSLPEQGSCESSSTELTMRILVTGASGWIGSASAAAARTDGVVHLGYNHDFAQMATAAKSDRAGGS